jgi:predicted nucleic acid-binding protein
METFASLKTEMEATGKRVDDFDLVIAATAIVQGCRLVTNNERHFRGVPGLEIENWAKPIR